MLTYAAVLRINNLASMLAQLAKEVDASYLTSLLLPPLVLRAPQDKKCLADLRATAVLNTPAEAGRIFKQDSERWGAVIKANNIKGE